MSRTAMMPAALIAVLVLAPAAPARADILGLLVNELFQKIMEAGNAPPPPPPPGDLRTIPESATPGVLDPPRSGRLVTISGDELRMSPGCKIRDFSNRIVLPSHIAEPVPVRYELDHIGQVRRIWLMTRS